MGLALISSFFAAACARLPQNSEGVPTGVPVIAPDAHLTNQVGGLERTNGDSTIVDVAGQSFKRALQVRTRMGATETNATQMTLPINRPVEKGDVMLAHLWIRGAASGGQSQGRIELLFERTVSPWTKSVTQGVVTSKNSSQWKPVWIPFQSAEKYNTGEAMVSLRFATQAQTVEVGGLVVSDLGQKVSLDDLTAALIEKSPIGKVSVKVDMATVRQTMLGFGGDFCQPRYGSSDPMDVVGQYSLDHLHVAHARVGFPMNNWNPQPGEFRDDAQAHAALLALQEMTRRHIPTVLTVWEGPGWMLGGSVEQSGRELDPAKYGVCTDAIVRYLKLARDTYGASVDYFSFNEPDYGVNFKFTPTTMGNFIRQAGPQFQAAGLKTKFLVGDTGGGSEFRDYALPLLSDPTIAPFLGPISFHCWDGLGAAEASYIAIAQLGKKFSKPVWCLEAGWDAGLWQAPNPWGSWDNGLKTAMVYERTLRLTGAILMDYWTYQDNYPIVDKVGPRPYPVFYVIKQMEDVFKPGARIVTTTVSDDSLQAMVTIGPTKGRFAALIVNASGPGSAILTGLPPGNQVRMLLSDKSAQGRDLGLKTVSKDGTLTIQVPARSVITFVR